MKKSDEFRIRAASMRMEARKMEEKASMSSRKQLAPTVIESNGCLIILTHDYGNPKLTVAGESGGGASMYLHAGAMKDLRKALKKAARKMNDDNQPAKDGDY